jgi:hypothetical protein
MRMMFMIYKKIFVLTLFILLISIIFAINGQEANDLENDDSLILDEEPFIRGQYRHERRLQNFLDAREAYIESKNDFLAGRTTIINVKEKASNVFVGQTDFILEKILFFSRRGVVLDNPSLENRIRSNRQRFIDSSSNEEKKTIFLDVKNNLLPEIKNNLQESVMVFAKHNIKTSLEKANEINTSLKEFENVFEGEKLLEFMDLVDRFNMEISSFEGEYSIILMNDDASNVGELLELNNELKSFYKDFFEELNIFKESLIVVEVE